MAREREIVPSPERRSSDYEPPRVERVLDPDDLEREIVYAGGQVITVSGS
jgi:hypothetical protein